MVKDLYQEIPKQILFWCEEKNIQCYTHQEFNKTIDLVHIQLFRNWFQLGGIRIFRNPIVSSFHAHIHYEEWKKEKEYQRKLVLYYSEHRKQNLYTFMNDIQNIIYDFSTLQIPK